MEVEAWLARAAAARPEHTALRTLREEWSYARLHAAARAGAGELAARGAGVTPRTPPLEPDLWWEVPLIEAA